MGGAFALPWVTSHLLACILFFIQGASMSIVDTAGNVVLLTLWRGSSWQNGALHAFHFIFGIGATVAPAVVHAILLEGGRAAAAWLAVGATLVPCCVAFAVLGFFPQPIEEKDPATESQGEATESQGEATESQGEGGSLDSRMVVIFTCTFLFIYIGIEVAFGGFVDLFAVRWLLTPAPDAATLNAFYWGGLSVSRAVAALTTSFVNHARFLLCHLVLMLVSITVLAAITRNEGGGITGLETAMVAVFGFALGPLFPGALLVAEELNGQALPQRVTGYMIASAACGEMVLPLLIAVAFAQSPWNLVLGDLILCWISVVIFLFSLCPLLMHKNKQQEKDTSASPMAAPGPASAD